MFCGGKCSSSSVDGAECIGGEILGNVARFAQCKLNESDCKSTAAAQCNWCSSQEKCYMKTDFPCSGCGITNSGDCPTTAGCGWCDKRKCLPIADATICKAEETKDAVESGAKSGLKSAARLSCELARTTHTCCPSDCSWDLRPTCGNCGSL